jgi:hypothetical protein
MQDSAGSAICLQDPYAGENSGKVYAVNNIAIGGRDDRIHRYMSNGLFLNGIVDCQIVNNYVFRTGQNAIQIYSISRCLLQDNDFESTGGGGNPTIVANGMKDTVLRRNNFREREGLGISTAAGILDSCGQGNTYDGNLILGEVKPPVTICTEK